MKLITFSLFGDNPLYCKGAVENSILAKKIYKDWTARFYVSDDVPEKYIRSLRQNDAEVIICKRNSEYDALNWRFRPFRENDVEFWISRDCDSRLSWRERRAVDEWINTNKSFHLMRDCHNHGYSIMAGMFGVNNSLFQNRYGLINLDINYSNQKNIDQIILHDVVWKLISNDHVCHDHWNHTKPSGFPTTQMGDHVNCDKAYGIGLYNYVTGGVKIQHPHLYLPTQDNRPFPEHEPMEYGVFVGQVIGINGIPEINTDVRWEYELRGLSTEIMGIVNE